jgi:hypothetical protein
LVERLSLSVVEVILYGEFVRGGHPLWRGCPCPLSFMERLSLSIVEVILYGEVVLVRCRGHPLWRGCRL